MSYILDALKKSEKERQRGNVPDIHTLQYTPALKTRQHRLVLYLVLVALLVNAGLLVGWLVVSPRKPQSVSQSVAPLKIRPKSQVSAEDTAVALSRMEVPAPAKGAADSGIPPAEKEPTPQTAATSNRQALIRTAQQNQSPNTVDGQGKGAHGGPSAQATARAAREKTPELPQQTVVSQAPVEPQSVAYSEAPIKNKLYSLKELPASVQQSLPDFSISTHLYSADSASRMVRINGQILREGEHLNAGVKVDEITSDGVIFLFQDYRFRVGLR